MPLNFGRLLQSASRAGGPILDERVQRKEVERKRTLEDALRAQQDEARNYDIKTMRPLREDESRARTKNSLETTTRNIDPNSEAGIMAAERRARAAAKAAADFGVEEVADPDSPTGLRYVRRSQAPGESPQAPSGGLGGAAMRRSLAENRARIRDIDNALELHEKQPKATGGLLRDIADIVPATSTAVSKYDQGKHPEYVAAQAAIANIGSLVIHDRSGAAVTISEFPRLVPFIPLKGDSPAVVQEKLGQLKQQITRLVEEMEAASPSPVQRARGPQRRAGDGAPQIDLEAIARKILSEKP
jgi:hypothetical protein